MSDSPAAAPADPPVTLKQIRAATEECKNLFLYACRACLIAPCVPRHQILDLRRPTRIKNGNWSSAAANAIRLSEIHRSQGKPIPARLQWTTHAAGIAGSLIELGEAMDRCNRALEPCRTAFILAALNIPDLAVSTRCSSAHEACLIYAVVVWTSVMDAIFAARERDGSEGGTITPEDYVRYAQEIASRLANVGEGPDGLIAMVGQESVVALREACPPASTTPRSIAERVRCDHQSGTVYVDDAPIATAVESDYLSLIDELVRRNGNMPGTSLQKEKHALAGKHLPRICKRVEEKNPHLKKLLKRSPGKGYWLQLPPI